MLNERDLNQLLDELNTIAIKLEPDFQRIEVRHSIAVARAKLAAKASCNHSIEKSLESIRNSDKVYFRILELCKLANTYVTDGELVKAKDILVETTKSVHQLEFEHDRVRAYFVIQGGLLRIVKSIHNWCVIQPITEVIDTISRQIEVSENLFWKLEKMRVKDKIDYIEDLLWKLINESTTNESADESRKKEVLNKEPIKPTPSKDSRFSKEPKDVPEYIRTYIVPENVPKYIKTYIIQLKNPNSQPSKIRRYIEKEGVITRGDLKRACVEHLGFKSEHGGIGATVKALETIGYIEIDGKGNRKRIKSLNPEISTNR